MDMNPQRVRTAEFKTVKKGLDPGEVHAFLTAVADELERAQNQSTAMEARARAAVARLQELSDDASQASAEAARTQPAAEPAAAGSAEEVHASVDESETISRTLLLAQRTADMTIAEAEAEANKLRTDAESEVNRSLETSRELASSLLDQARAEAHKVGDEERQAIDSEVNALAARRDFLEGDVDHLEQFLVDQRSRLREAATEITALAERVPGGLGDVRRPILSASDGAEVSVDGAGETSAVGGASRGHADASQGHGDGSDDADADASIATVGTGTPGNDDTDGDDTDGNDLWLPDDDADDAMPVIDTDTAPGSRRSFGGDTT